MEYKHTQKIIKSLENKYGTFSLNSAYNYMIEAGRNNFDDESVAKIKADIIETDKKISEQGKTSLITADMQCEIVDIANELSKLPLNDLLVYMQEEMYFDVGQGGIDKKRATVLLGNALDIIYHTCVTNEQFIETLCEDMNMSDAELEHLLYNNGYDEVANEYFGYEKNENQEDEPNICD